MRDSRSQDVIERFRYTGINSFVYFVVFAEILSWEWLSLKWPAVVLLLLLSRIIIVIASQQCTERTSDCVCMCTCVLKFVSTLVFAWLWLYLLTKMVCTLRASHCPSCRHRQLFTASAVQEQLLDVANPLLTGDHDAATGHHHTTSVTDSLDNDYRHSQEESLWQHAEAVMMTRQHKPVTSSMISSNGVDFPNAEAKHQEEILWLQIERRLSVAHWMNKTTFFDCPSSGPPCELSKIGLSIADKVWLRLNLADFAAGLNHELRYPKSPQLYTNSQWSENVKLQ